MSDAWEEIQAVKSKRNELRERLQKRRKEREDLLGGSTDATTSNPTASVIAGLSRTISYLIVNVVLNYFFPFRG